MKQDLNNLQAQFSGFYNTPHLFLKPVLGLVPLLTAKHNTPAFKGLNLDRKRLGQRVERFVTTELIEDESITVLSENIQIKTRTKQTIGELDCLYLKYQQPIHLEIQFKFYLYNPALGETEIQRCIGPMRRDNLLKKLTKLKTKQLPLLYNTLTKSVLSSLGLKAESFKQKIYFKAQLFIPFGETVQFTTLNPACIYGFYFKYEALNKFVHCKFYKPKKTDWLLDVSPNVTWETSYIILPKLMVFKAEAYAPLLWIKFPSGEIYKCFVVPW